MSAWEAFRSGLSLAWRSKRIILWIWLASFLMALGPAWLVSQQIEDSLGSSAKAEAMARGYDDEWFAVFETRAEGLAATFDPTVAGAGAIFNALDDWLSGRHGDYFPGVVVVALAYLLLWVFATGGILTYYETYTAPGLRNFSADGARYLGRFLRLLLIGAVGYLLIFGWLGPWLIDFVNERNRDVIDERVAFLWTLFGSLILWAFLMALALVMDYSKILTVLEDRRSMLGAFLSSLILAARNAFKVAPLYLLNVLLAVLVVVVYTLLAPGAGQSTWLGVLWALFLGQLFIALRIFVRLCFLASQTELARVLTAEPGNQPAEAQREPETAPT